MKPFLSQQKGDYGNTKALNKKVSRYKLVMCIAVTPLLPSTLELDDDPTLTNTHRKQMYEERKHELLAQQRQGEQEHLQTLKTIAEQDAVDFRLKTLQERRKWRNSYSKR